jgi:hypothetical protein
MEYRSQLIDLYAKYEAAAVTSTPEYEQLSRRYGEQSEFRTLRSQLQDMKAKVQGIKTTASSQEQLRSAIHLLRQYRWRGTERDLFYDLLVAIYADRWGAARVAYLDKALAAVRLSRDYFLSFTARHAAPGVNPINDRYQYFIMKKLQRPLNYKEKRVNNLFAEAVHQIFSVNCERKWLLLPNEQR